MMQLITIASSKKKNIKLTVISIVFVAIGCWMVATADAPNSKYNPTEIKIWGSLGITFFGLCMVVGLIKLFGNQTEIILNDQGITY